MATGRLAETTEGLGIRFRINVVHVTSQALLHPHLPNPFLRSQLHRREEFPEFRSLVAKGRRGDKPKEGLSFEQDGQRYSIDPQICGKLGLTPQTATIREVVKGSDHTQAVVYVIDIHRTDAKTGRLVEGTIALKVGPEVARETRAYRLAHRSPIKDFLLPNVRSNSGDRSFIAMPYLDPVRYIDLRTALEEGIVTPGEVPQLFDSVAGPYNEWLRRNLRIGRGGVSMQKSEWPSYLSNLRETAALLAEHMPLKPDGTRMTVDELWQSNLHIRRDGETQIIPSFAQISSQTQALRDEMDMERGLRAVRVNEDASPKNFFYDTQAHQIVATFDFGYAAVGGERAIVPAALAIRGKGVASSSVQSQSPLSVSVGEGHVSVTNFDTIAVAPAARLWQEYALSRVPEDARFLGRFDPNLLRAQIHGHLAINLLNAVGILGKKLPSSMPTLIFLWSELGEQLRLRNEYLQRYNTRRRGSRLTTSAV